MTANMVALDEVDKVILNALQKNGRITNVDLAMMAGISAPPCLRRVRLMEERGIIKSFHAVVDPKALGFFVKAICIVSLTSQSSEIVDKFLKIIDQNIYIRSCFSSPGAEFFVLVVVAESVRKFDSVLRKLFNKSEIVSKVSSYFLLNAHKNEFGVPISFSSESDSE